MILNFVQVYYSLLLILIVFLLYKLCVYNFDYWEKRKVNFIKPVPLFGNLFKALLFQKGIGFLLADFYNEVQDSFFGIFSLHEPVLVVKDPELIKQILVKDFDNFRDRSSFTDEKIDDISANLLFFAKYKKWKLFRKNLTPLFTSGKLKSMFAQVENVAEDLKENISRKMYQCGMLDARELCNRFSMDVLTSCIFGLNGECLTKEDAIFYQIGQRVFGTSFLNDLRIFGYVHNEFFIKLTRLTLLDSYVINFLKTTFRYQLKEREKSDLKRNDVIDLLKTLKEYGKHESLFREEIVLISQPVQFFLAGYETVSTTLSFAFYELALHPEAHKKLAKEIRDVIKNGGKLNYETIHKLPYLDLVVKETLRKYPVLPFLDRRCTKEYKVPNSDLVLQPGVKVFIPMYGLHYDEKYFSNPQDFIPERFSEDYEGNFNPLAYMPFGNGPKVCLGERFSILAVKLGIAQILSEFNVETCKETPYNMEFKPRGITLLPEKKLFVKFVKVENN